MCTLPEGLRVGVQLNGSSIRPWWIHHHYWAAITMALLLTLPVDSSAVQAFVRKFLWWSTFQARISPQILCVQHQQWVPCIEWGSHFQGFNLVKAFEQIITHQRPVKDTMKPLKASWEISMHFLQA